MTTWLLTREADDAQSERDVLDARGLSVIEVPCVETRFRPWPWLDARGVTLFTSRRAVQAWERSGKPKLGAVASLAPSTRGALEALGVEVAVSSDGGTVALAEMIVKRGAFDLARYPTSNAGRESPEQAAAMNLLGRLGDVDRQVVYEVSPPADLASTIASSTGSPWSAIFASPSAVRHFLLAHVPALAPTTIVCVGTSTAREWDERKPTHWPVAMSTRDLRRTLTEVI